MVNIIFFFYIQLFLCYSVNPTHISGLDNYRNNCFMNCVIQWFSNVPSLHRILDGQNKNNYLSKKILSTIGQLQSGTIENDLYLHYNKVRNRSDSLTGGDALDFYTYLMDSVLENYSCSDENEHWRILETLNKGTHENFIFQQQLESVCQFTKENHTFYSSGYFLSINMERSGHYEMKDFSQFTCFCCNKPLLNKKKRIKKLPLYPVLVFHNLAANNVLNDNFDLCKFLNLNSNDTYRIKAIIKHSENHFRSFVEISKSWHEFDDKSVKILGSDIPLDDNVYMVMFEKGNCQVFILLIILIFYNLFKFIRESIYLNTI
jgi:hypothetical protein